MGMGYSAPNQPIPTPTLEGGGIVAGFNWNYFYSVPIDFMAIALIFHNFLCFHSTSMKSCEAHSQC